ncbi:MAG: NlpC/P60 family protein, partial [Oscillospiraceae bacterium]|nr:NlpC/P60 family protein [Oscillospiraceae bacterium]
ETKIHDLNIEIDKKQIIVEKAHKATLDAQEAFKERAEELYKYGSNNYIEGLMKSKGLEDFIQRLSYIRKAMSTDQLLVENCEKTEQNYNDKVSELQSVLKEQEDLKTANEIKVGELNTYKEQQQKNIDDLENKKKANSNLITESQLVIDLSKYNIDYTPNRGSDPDPVSLALSFVNKTPYVWGGTSPDGFDCSGLVVYCYRQVLGMILPRTAEMQQCVGVAIPENEMQRGDLIFYGYPAHHVAIYVGNGMMVDAPYTGKDVSVEPVHVYSDFSGARRVR